MPDQTSPSLSMLLADRSQRPALLPPLPPAQMPLPPLPPIQPSTNVQDLRNLQGPPLPGLPPQPYQQLPGPTPQMLSGPMPRDAGYYDIDRLANQFALEQARRTMGGQQANLPAAPASQGMPLATLRALLSNLGGLTQSANQPVTDAAQLGMRG
jgi:hypothetical protein